MYALIKKQMNELTANYILPSESNPRELIHLDGSRWTLVEWRPELVTAEVWNEIIVSGGKCFDTADQINNEIKTNFFNEEITI